MITFVPDYYGKFSCIAEKCTHNCCIGWEIDIDEETLGKYFAMGGDMGKRLQKNISFDETPHFELCADEKCPFLNSRGLCDIIINCDEDHLCEICRMHPRFVNTYSDFCEMGLGLCCEEAARIIVSRNEKLELVCDGQLPYNILCDEADFIAERAEIFEILQDGEKSVYQRICILCEIYGIDISFLELPALCDIYLSLERLDEKWTECLAELSQYDFSAESMDIPWLECVSRNLMCYFIFRHAVQSLYDGDMESKIRFALSGAYVICALCAMHKEKTGNISEKDIAEYARMFSAEVEYSEENTQTLFEIL